MKKLVVTGATGFIGSHFIKFLTDCNIEVLALGRKDFHLLSEQRQDRLRKAQYLKLDMRYIIQLPQLVNESNFHIPEDSVFVNLAWGGVDTLSDLDIEAQLNNVTWCVDALEAASRINCRRFVHIGTMEEAFTYKYLDLDYKTSSNYNRHVIYSIAKIAAKNSLKAKAAIIGMDFIHILHSHVMGPDDDKDSFLQVTLKKLVKGDDLTFSSGEQLFDVVSLDDCCQGYLLACEKGLAGAEYWVGSGNPRKLKEYVERMYKLYPSSIELNFGSLPYNDIILEESDFSTKLLTEHTGYQPKLSYEEIVTQLYHSIFT